MDEPQVMRIDRFGEVATAVDAAALGVKLNDMIRDAEGRLYIDAYPAEGDDVGRSSIVMVDVDGSVSIVADGLSFPNGLALTADRRTLLVAETKGARISAWTVAGDGTLFDQRVWAETPGLGPDGICLDAEGALWVGCPWANKAVRIAEGGEILDSISFPGRWVTACGLGGEDGRTLLLTTTVLGPGGYAAAVGEAVGYVETRRVDVPGVGLAGDVSAPNDEGDDK
jgi:sugar lactone lactonase YvrE